MSENYRPECLTPSFTDISIWPYDVQIKGGNVVRVNAPDPRAAQRKAVMGYRKGARWQGQPESIALTAGMMHRILGVDSALTRDEQASLSR
jgi:hypothetical protein